ncbi:MAG TPA: carboxyl transferase domain-containing protein, partial [Candidatus Hypogeohydataceae bacterium YC38]
MKSNPQDPTPSVRPSEEASLSQQAVGANKALEKAPAQEGFQPENLTPYDIVKLARHPLRPTASDYINLMLDDFIELHGDRRFGDDRAIITGLARLGPHRLMLIGQQKGKSTKERILCNFGMPNPEGYRKALLKMKLAEKLHVPVVALIDTPGANPDIGAEERGQAYAIAENIYQMIRLRTPIINVVIGEGGSGGALGIGVG